jgi:hypothetical protein
VSPRQVAVIAVIAGACGLTAAASFTTPFTFGADLIVAVTLGVMLVGQVVVEIRSRRVPTSSDATVTTETPRKLRSYVAWIAVFAAFTTLELFTYFEHPRAAYPTFSSLSDELSASQAGKAVLFVAWLCLGWLFLSASGRKRKRRTEP